MSSFILYTVILTIILAAIGFWLQYGKGAEIKQRKAAKNWPSTTGTVVDTNIEQFKRTMISRQGTFFIRTLSIDFFKPVITYNYQVDGTGYQSSKYRNGILSRSGEWSGVLPKKVEEIIAQHPAGKLVTVFYNPSNPAQAYLALDTSTTKQNIHRIFGFVFFAAAALLLVMGAIRVAQNIVKQSADKATPAVLAVSTSQLKEDFLGGLGLAACEYDEQTPVGEIIDYGKWACEAKSGTQVRTVWFFSRDNDPEKVDYLQAKAANMEVDQEAEYLADVAVLAVPIVDNQQVLEWLQDTLPTLKEAGSEANNVFSGINFELKNNSGYGVWMYIGNAR